ncbi:MAG TPA: formate--tetrahydrofolate ligase [Nitrospiraceae bacterium]|nr:formate--tetrahydrofolate ligase [Nitrospiraceae bacterium]
MSDYDIARSVTPRPIIEVGEGLGLRHDELIPYGRWKAKVSLACLDRLSNRPRARYVLVTAVNPTPLGEGKTTTSIGLAMGLCRLGHRAVVTLRQPSLGPVFGIKGGGAGGGKAQVIPMEDVNLHLTGDAHAVAASHNLLSSFVDNHLFHGNALNLDPGRIAWPRAMSVSDRALRQVRIESSEGVPGRRAQFVITEASEAMAILALASDPTDLRQRFARILVGLTRDGQPVSAEDLKCAGAMAALLKDALCPNLLQTLEGTPAFVHTGPFGNIAHGNSSILADAIALRSADYVVTEAGFGSELGAEKFFNIKCRASRFSPDAAVVVATLRALKLHGGGGTVRAGKPLPAGLTGPNRDALARGLANLEQHIANVKAFGVPAVVAINAFPDDPEDELQYVREQALAAGAAASAVSTHWVDGGKGAEELARAVVQASQGSTAFTPLYPDSASIKQKIETIARRMYGAAGVRYEEQAETQIETAAKLGFGHFPICMAKTPLSLSHDATLKGRPSGFTVPIKELRILAGAGFLTAVCSGIQLMPGLPMRPAGERIDLDPDTGQIVGLT